MTFGVIYTHDDGKALGEHSALTFSAAHDLADTFTSITCHEARADIYDSSGDHLAWLAGMDWNTCRRCRGGGCGWCHRTGQRS